MRIDDLSYLENILEVNAISGGVIVGVTAGSLAAGSSSVALTDTSTRAKVLRNGGSIGIGLGVAIAIGIDPLAGVEVYGSGDKVIEATKVYYSTNKDVEVAGGLVVAIEYP
jgi:hypothetical protein